VAAQVDIWLAGADLAVTGIDIDGARVTVGLAGLSEPPSAYQLALDLVPLLGSDAEAVVEWDQRAQGVARADSPPAVDPVAVATVVVQRWIDDIAATGQRFELLDLSVHGDRVDVEVTGPTAPPAPRSLPDDVAAAIGRPVELSMRWIQQLDPELQGEAPADRLARHVKTWIGPRSGVRLVDTEIDGDTITIDLAIAGDPLGIETLRAVAIAAVDGTTRVEIRSLPLTVLPGGTDAPTPPLID
jgi:hypothetical protein